MRRAAVAIAVLFLARLAMAEADPVFSVSASWEGEGPREGRWSTLVVRVAVDEGWHVNSNAPLDPYLVPTVVTVTVPPGWTAEKPEYPRHRLMRFSFSEERVAVFAGTFSVRVRVRPGAGTAWPATLEGRVEAQACNDVQCLAPAAVVFSVPIDGTGAPGAVRAQSSADDPNGVSPAAGDRAGRFARSGLLFQLVLAFLAGLALNLTPCVYPLIPITVGFFASQRSQNRSTTWLLAASYVLGMALMYSALGVVAALTGRLFGAALQSPWVVGAIAVVMLALAASMFGAWELRVPAWATRMSGGRSGVGGALFMGLIVGVVAAPCIGPFVLGLLTYVGQRQSALLGFALFFALAIGLGVPYLLLGVSTKALDRFPASGAWMLGVRQLFGVLLVGLAAYFVAPLCAEPWGGRLLAATLGLGGLYLLVLARPAHEHPLVDRFMRLASAALVVAAVLLWPPSEHAGAVGVTWNAYDQREVEAAIAAGGPVVLDFYADWCLPCKELDERTFTDAAVVQRLAGFSRFKVDLTRADDTTDAVRAHFDVAGVPTIAFFIDGVEVRGERLTGFEPPERFLARLDRLAPQQKR